MLAVNHEFHKVAHVLPGGALKRRIRFSGLAGTFTNEYVFT
jgi:hypothetical protein